MTPKTVKKMGGSRQKTASEKRQKLKCKVQELKKQKRRLFDALVKAKKEIAELSAKLSTL